MASRRGLRSNEKTPRNIVRWKTLLVLLCAWITCISASSWNERGYDTATGTQALCWKSPLEPPSSNVTDVDADVDPSLGSSSGFESSTILSSAHRISTVCSQKDVRLKLFHPILVVPSSSSSSSSESLLRTQEATSTNSRTTLTTRQEYEYPVEISIDWVSLFEPDVSIANRQSSEQVIPSPATIMDGGGEDSTQLVRMAVKLLFCAVGQTGFCSPFVHDESLMTMKSEEDSLQPSIHNSPTSSHIDSETTWVEVNATHPSLLALNLTLPATIPTAGEYFPIVALQFYTKVHTRSAVLGNSNMDALNGTNSTSGSTTPIRRPIQNNNFQVTIQQEQFRWDIANALDPSSTSSRVLSFSDPPMLDEISKGVEWFSYAAIIVAGLILGALIWQTWKHRKQPVLNLSQAEFLAIYLFAALVATGSVFLLQPKNDLYCQIRYPLQLIPIQLLYSITMGRLWRINAVVSPLLLEQYRKKLKHKNVWSVRLLGWLQYFSYNISSCFCCYWCYCLGGRGEQRKKRRSNRKGAAGMRRSVSSQTLAKVIFAFWFPQVIFQTLGLLLQPQEMVLEWSDQQGRARCSNGVAWYKSFLTYGYATLIMLIAILLIMAFSSRKLPSLFNETSVIYNTTFHTLLLIILGSIVVGISNDPDLEYLVWVAVILSITLGSSLRLMVPKLKMVFKGETVVVSKLVSDHHRQQREKRAATSQANAGTDKLLENVTGLDTSYSGAFNGHGSFSSDLDNSASYSYYDQLTPVSQRARLDVLSNRQFGGQQTSTEETLDDSSASFPIQSVTDIHAGDGSLTPPPRRTAGVHDDVETGNILDALDAPPLSSHTIENESSGNSPADGNQNSNSRIEELRSKREQGKNLVLEKLDSVRELTSPQNRAVIPPKNTFIPKPHPSVVPLPAKGLERQRTTRAVVAATASNIDRRKTFLKKRSSRYITGARQRITVSPDETPPRRLVLKMVDLQEELAEVNGHIMSGLVVKPEKWDAVVDLVRRLDKNFQEDVVFSWRKPLLPPTTLAAPGWQASTNPTADGASAAEMTNDTQIISEPNGITPNARKKNSLSRVENEFRKVVDVRDRKYKMIMYEDVFIGTEAVDAMMYAGLAATRKEAVALGRRLASERRLFKHVTNEHPFEDKYFFYHYVDRDEDSLSSMDDEDNNDNTRELRLSDVLEISERGVADDEATRFREVVTVRDRRYRMKLYPKVFVGSEAIDAIVYHGLAKTRWEAVQLGRKLARELKLFKHVCGEHELRDEYLFYHYREDHRISGSASIKSGDVSSQQQLNRSPLAEKADAFRMYVDVRDRRYLMQTYKQSFIGSEAVDALLYAGLATTRDEAVELGRTLQKELRLFRSVLGDREFEDGFVFYRIRGEEMSPLNGNHDNSDVNSRSSVGDQHSSRSSYGELHAGSQKSNSYSVDTNLPAKVEAFKQFVVVKDRTYHFRKYKNVFVGCEAVDAMVFHGLANTRKEAVQLGRAMARDCNLFKHVAEDTRHAFSDEFLFFRYTIDGDVSSSMWDQSISTNTDSLQIGQLTRPSSQLAEKAEEFKSCLDIRDRMSMMVRYKSCFIGSEAVDGMLFSELVKTREEAVELGRTLERELRLFQHVTSDHPFSDDDTMYYRLREDNGFQTVAASDLESNGPGSMHESASSAKSDVAGKVDLFKRIILPLVRDRKYHMKTYRDVFVGEEAVDSLIYAGFANDRKEAVYLGREIAKQYNIFAHATGDHAFCDSFLFYQFREENTSGNNKMISCPVPDSGSSQASSAFSNTSRGELGKIADRFRGCVDVRDRIYRMIKYKLCFIGCEAVDAIIFAGLAETRAEAVILGQKLSNQLRFFKSCTGTKNFEDTYSLYRFRDDEEVGSSNQSKFSESEASIPRSELLNMSESFRGCTQVKDRTFRFRTYKQCFIGCDTVDALVEAGVVESRKDAVEYGRTLARELKLFQHVTGDHAFADDYLFFSFRLDSNNMDSDHRSISTFGGDLVGDLPVVEEVEEGSEHEPLTDSAGRFNPAGATLSLPVVMEGHSSDEDVSNQKEETPPADVLDAAKVEEENPDAITSDSKQNVLYGEENV